VTSDENSAAQNTADAKIQAHSKQHQRKMSKVIGIVVMLVFVAGCLVAGNYLLTSSDPFDVPMADKDTSVEMTDSEMAALREQFKQALAQYENNTQPSIDEIMLSDYQQERASELSLLKQQSLTAFARGSFLQAKQALEILNKKSNTLISDWSAQIDKHVAAGQEAFNSNQIPQAQLSVNKALALSSSNVAALELQNRLYAYDEVSKLMGDLNIALNENNWPKQVEVITDIIELDPNRTELTNDLEKAQNQYDQQQLSQFLAKADKALEAGQLDKAQDYVEQAKKVKPNSNGAKAISERINEARAKNSLADIKSTIQAAVEQDDWNAVNSLLLVNVKKYPNDSELKAFQAQAQQVLAAKNSLAVFTARPERLADDNIREAASKAVQSSFAASLLSVSLQKQIEQVANAIDQYNNPVEVQVISDGKTYLTVLGVGHVGQHKNKTISLTPGTYVLQAKREGYRNKRLEFTVKANTPVSLTLICDEPI
jgi:hypothetical protein